MVYDFGRNVFHLHFYFLKKNCYHQKLKNCFSVIKKCSLFFFNSSINVIKSKFSIYQSTLT